MKHLIVQTTFPRTEDEVRIRKRDEVCVYCRKKRFSSLEKGTREHFNHRKDWDSVGDYYKKGKDVTEIIGICCRSCNSSRSDKSLTEWFESEYCIERGINYESVADVIKKYIDKYEKPKNNH